MTPKTVLYALCFLSALTARTLHATQITFEGFPYVTAFFPGESLSSQGFVFQNLGSHPVEVSGNIPAGIPSCSPPCADNGTQYLLTQVDGLLRLTHSTGQPFALSSLDAAESFSGLPEFWARQVVVTGEVVGGATAQALFDLDLINDGTGGVSDFQTFALPPTFSDLTALTIAGAGNVGRNDFSIDNLRLTVVPEPNSVVLLGLGGLGLTCAFRRSKSRNFAERRARLPCQLVS